MTSKQVGFINFSKMLLPLRNNIKYNFKNILSKSFNFSCFPRRSLARERKPQGVAPAVGMLAIYVNCTLAIIPQRTGVENTQLTGNTFPSDNTVKPMIKTNSFKGKVYHKFHVKMWSLPFVNGIHCL